MQQPDFVFSVTFGIEAADGPQPQPDLPTRSGTAASAGFGSVLRGSISLLLLSFLQHDMITLLRVGSSGSVRGLRVLVLMKIKPRLPHRCKLETLKPLEGQEMRIGELAAKADVRVATIRYYEQSGLLEKAARSESNYRRYGSEAASRLGFIKRCRSLGIGLAEIRRLLDLAKSPEANCSEVDVLLDEHITNVREQRRGLAKLERELKKLRADCHPSRRVRGCGILRYSTAAVHGAR